MKLIAQDATVLPKGWLMVDPALAQEIGINPAIIFQTIDGWVQHNRRRGKNIKGGRAWSYNTIPNWGSVFCWMNPSYVGKLIRDLEKDGRLVSAKLAKHASDQTKYYSTAAGSIPESNPQQMSLWPVENMTLRGRKVPHDSSIGTTKDNPSKVKKTNTNTRVGLTMGGVGVFPAHIPGSEPPERKPEVPELPDTRSDADEHEPVTLIQGTPATTNAKTIPPVPRAPLPVADEPTDEDSVTEDETKSSGATPAVDVPHHAKIFAIQNAEVRRWIALEPDRLEAWCAYAAGEDGIESPGGFVRSAMRTGGMPPVKTGVAYNPKGTDYITGELADFIQH